MVDEALEYPEEDILNDREHSSLDGRRTCSGEQREVERVHAVWFPGSHKIAPTVRS